VTLNLLLIPHHAHLSTLTPIDVGRSSAPSEAHLYCIHWISDKMAPSQQLLRSARPLLQTLTIKPTASAASKFSTSSRTAFRNQKAQTSFQFRFQAKNFFQKFGRSQKRQQSGAAGTGATGGGATGGAKAEGPSWFNGPIGPKTVHFW
jgi:type II secretory pathway component GspD/PulD (secretin)